MALLSWDKPRKVRSTEAHAERYQADGAPPGTFVPNMSEADKFRWKAKSIGGKDPRIEIRKTTEGIKVTRPGSYGPFASYWEGNAQVLIVVRPDGTVTFSANGKARFDVSELTAVFGECCVEMSKWH